MAGSSDQNQIEKTTIPEESNNDKKSKSAAANVEGKVIPTQDIYEQNKLDDIFRKAREGNSEPFSFANAFLNKTTHASSLQEETGKSDVYE